MSVLVVLGTRPEAIKLAPVVKELRARRVPTRVCVTGQHREMLTPLLSLFRIVPDYDLDVMTPDQTLSSLTGSVLSKVEKLVADAAPDWVVVQGDTTTAMAASLAAFYRRIPVAHVEAGLRTYDLDRPFPEEANRRIIDTLARLYFAPTARARNNLLAESVDPALVHLTGNTGIDALLDVAGMSYDVTRGPLAEIDFRRRVVLVTAHRRENFGKALQDICLAIRDLADRFEDVQVIYPVHLNPNVGGPVRRVLGDHQRITLLAPLDYVALVQLMRRSALILTDSGGIQEEAPTFGKPVLILRDVTERQEAIEAGCARIVGADRDVILSAATELLTDRRAYERMARVANPFGDGHASRRIVDLLEGRAPVTPTEPAGATAPAR